YGLIVRQIWVSVEIFRFNDDLHNRMSVGYTKSMTIGIECHAKLTFPPYGFKFECFRIKAAIGGRERYRIPIRKKWRIHFSTVESTGNIYPSIQSQSRMAGSDLGRPGIKKTGQNHFPHLCFSISIRILQIPDIR